MENGCGMETDVHAPAQGHRRMHRCCTRRSFPSPSRLHPLHHQAMKVSCTQSKLSSTSFVLRRRGWNSTWPYIYYGPHVHLQ